eukprot:6677855-Prymnesium_polylepis.2
MARPGARSSPEAHRDTHTCPQRAPDRGLAVNSGAKGVDMVILKSYNRPNLTTPPLKTSVRRAQNAQDERLGPPWSHALSESGFTFFTRPHAHPHVQGPAR